MRVKKEMDTQMIRARLRLSLITMGASLLVLLSSAGPAFAAGPVTTGSGGSALQVKPARVFPDPIIPRGKSTNVSVTITNLSAQPATLQVIINDFGASKDESGNPAIILDPNLYAASHSLKRFVQPVGNVRWAPEKRSR